MSNQTVLVIAAHPDDEVLGCGGAIARHRAQNDRVEVLIMAEGITSRNTCDSSNQKAELAALHRLAAQANVILGVNNLTILNYPDNRMDSVDLLDVVKDIEKVIQRTRPQIIYTHHAGDVNVDHRKIHEAVVVAARPQPGCPVQVLLFFEVPSSTEWRPPASLAIFSPNWFINISDTLSLKFKALEVYHSEMRKFPHPRSILGCEYLARWRGASVGLLAAEAFELGRMIS